MKALVQNRYGSPDYLKIEEVPKPRIKKNEVLIRVKAVSINAGDYFSLIGSPWLVRLFNGFPNPKNYIMGWDAAGVVVETGEKVRELSPGDEVYTSGEHAFAEFLAVRGDLVAKKPKNLSFTEAAVFPTAGVTALKYMGEIARLNRNSSLLLNGASGGVGCFSVQIAKYLGAEMTGVCSTRNIEMIKNLGADYCFDYTKEDFSEGERKYDYIMDNVSGVKFSDMKRVLKPGGMILANSGYGGMSYVLKVVLLKTFTRYVGGMEHAECNRKRLNELKKLIEGGHLEPVIDRVFSFEELPEAFRYWEEFHPRGKIAVSFE